MRRLLVTLMTIILILFSFTAQGEDYSTYSQQALLKKRNELFQELSRVNTAYGTLVKTEELSSPSEDSLGSIISLFPDEQFAMLVRDKCGKFSINQPVSQADLDTITEIWLAPDYKPTDLTGIGYLRNVTRLHLYGNNYVTEIPEEIGNLKGLNYIDLYGCNITSLPESLFTIATLDHLELTKSKITSLPSGIGNWVNLRTLLINSISITELPEEIGNLVNLQTLQADHTAITKLPDSICNLINLQTLDVSDTTISELPVNIGNLLSLKNLNISNTKISALPESIWGLTLDKLDMSGTTIR